MKKVLLHICCGICAGYPIQRLQEDGYAVTGLFYNPNIQPQEEYEKRLAACRSCCELFGIPLVEGPYDESRWLAAVKGRESEPEGGSRCPVCYRFRLEFALAKANELSIDFFASTLTVSPHKDSQTINQLGLALEPRRFLPFDFKKKDGFKKTSDFARGHGLYRQVYCGCRFSRPQP